MITFTIRDYAVSIILNPLRLYRAWRVCSFREFLCLWTPWWSPQYDIVLDRFVPEWRLFPVFIRHVDDGRDRSSCL